MKRFIVLVLFVALLVLANTVFAAATWSVVSLNSVGCANDAINFSTQVSGWTSGGNERFRTIVDAGGLRYMDEDAGTPGSNGNYGWSLYDSSSGGPTTASFPLPPDTVITVHFQLIDGVGGPVLSEQVIYITKCNGGEIFTPQLRSDCLSLPPTAVVGRFTSDAVINWEPGKQTEPHAIIGTGQSAWVIGVDETGEFYKIIWSCEYRWVSVGTIGPNFDDVWQGRPLPTEVVS